MTRRVIAIALFIAACSDNAQHGGPVTSYENYELRVLAQSNALLALARGGADDCQKFRRDSEALLTSSEARALDTYRRAHRDEAARFRQQHADMFGHAIDVLVSLDEKCRLAK